MSVAEMLAKMPSSEITYWRKLFEMEMQMKKEKDLSDRASHNRQTMSRRQKKMFKRG